MDLHPTDEQVALTDMARNALADAFPVGHVRHDSPEAEVWQEIAALGLTGVLASEDCGGTNLTSVEASLVAHEVGLTLAPVSILWTMIAANVASLADELDLGARLVSGECWTTLEVGEVPRRMTAGRAGAEIVLSVRPEGAFLHRRNPKALAHSLPSLDRTTTLEVLEPGAIKVCGHAGPATWLTLSLLISAALTGTAQRMLDIAVAHGQTRIQFGKPIGSFQAVRHVCSEMARRVDAARSLVHYASVRLSTGHEEALDTAAAARVISTEAAAKNGAETLQILGAMGMTAEHELHLFIKRALLLERMLGRQRTELLELAILATP